jgi:hypothetical protein
MCRVGSKPGLVSRQLAVPSGSSVAGISVWMVASEDIAPEKAVFAPRFWNVGNRLSRSVEKRSGIDREIPQIREKGNNALVPFVYFAWFAVESHLNCSPRWFNYLFVCLLAKYQPRWSAPKRDSLSQ